MPSTEFSAMTINDVDVLEKIENENAFDCSVYCVHYQYSYLKEIWILIIHSENRGLTSYRIGHCKDRAPIEWRSI